MKNSRLDALLERILADKHSSEIEEMVESLPEDNRAACEQFCKQFDYLADNPEWLLRALLGCGSNLVDLLDDIILDRRMAEEKFQSDQSDTLRDLHLAGN